MIWIFLSCQQSNKQGKDVHEDLQRRILYYQKKTEQKKELIFAFAMASNHRLGGLSTRFLPDFVTCSDITQLIYTYISPHDDLMQILCMPDFKNEEKDI